MSLRDHLEKVRYYRAVCEAGTFRAAAETLHLSQSSVTVAIAKLEAAIDQQLLIRTKRGVRTTPAGAMLLEFARDLDYRLDAFEARLVAPDDPMAGLVRLGAYDSIAIYWLPHILGALKRAYPRLSLSISIGSSAKLIDRVRAGELDLALVAAPSADVRLDIKVLFQDSFAVYATAVGTRPLVSMFRARVSAEETLADCLRSKGVDLAGAMEVESFEIAKALALQGVGAAVLPRRVANFESDSTRLEELRELPRGFGRHPICLVNMREGRTPPIEAIQQKMIASRKGSQIPYKDGKL